MKWKEWIFGAVIVAFSIALSFVILEGGWKLFTTIHPRIMTDYSKRIMMWGTKKEPIEEEFGDLFFGGVNNEVHAEGIYFEDNSYNIEWNYTYRTNNYGLIQDADIDPKRDTVLFLGDSYTEGQGAAPWFNEITPLLKAKGFQGANAGVRGVGFEQFWRNEGFLVEKGLKVKKLVVVFISDDVRRPLWHFSPHDLDCLNSVNPCDFTEHSLPLPPEKEIPALVEKVRVARSKIVQGWRKRISTAMPATGYVYDYLANKFLLNQGAQQQSLQIKETKVAIKEMIEKYGVKNVVFIHLPAKEEIIDEPNYLGKIAREAIRKSGGIFFDGYTHCHLTVADYLVHDSHPNAFGYSKISKCVQEALPLIGL